MNDIGNDFYKRYLVNKGYRMNNDYLFDIYFSPSDKEAIQKCKTALELINKLISLEKLRADSGILPENKHEATVKQIFYALQPKVYFGELFYKAYLQKDDYMNGVFFSPNDIKEIRKAISNEGLIHALYLQNKINYLPKYQESEATLESIAKQIGLARSFNKLAVVKIVTLVVAVMITATLFTLKFVHQAF